MVQWLKNSPLSLSGTFNCNLSSNHTPLQLLLLILLVAQANQNSSAMAGQDMPAVSNPTYELENGQVDLEDVTVTDAEDDYSKKS